MSTNFTLQQNRVVSIVAKLPRIPEPTELDNSLEKRNEFVLILICRHKINGKKC